MTIPKVAYRYEGEELALYWTNPWSKQEEKIATFWWPTHPVEETKQVESWFERIANRACQERDLLPGTEERLKDRLGPPLMEQLSETSAEELLQEADEAAAKLFAKKEPRP